MIAVLLCLALVAAACGGSDDDDSSGASSTTTTTIESGETSTTADAIDDPAPIEELTFAAPTPDGTLLEVADDIRIGVLDNGLTYYVRSNDSPGGSVSMRLVVNAGGIDEDPLGTGAAHFLEHMMFNGTEKFPGNSLDAALRRIGAEIGPDFNAYTSDSETVYQIKVADQSDYVEVAFDVLEQWASAATIDTQEVIDEAPIVREEIRLRDESGQGLINVAFEQAYYLDTPFEGVNVSGTAETVGTLNTEDLRTYYDRWYRPDNMAVVAVGDRSLDELEALIVERFDDLEPRGDLAESPETANFPLRTEPYVEMVIEPSYGDSFISVDIPLSTWDLDTRGGNELAVTEQILGFMINNRLGEGVESGRLDLRRAGGGWFRWNRDLAYLGFNLDAEDLERGTEEFMTELQGSIQNPFTQSELDRAIDAFRSVQDQRLAQYGTSQDDDLANELVEHFLGGSDIQDIDTSYAMAIDFLDSLDIDAVNDHYGWMMTSAAPIVIVVGPDEDRVGDPANHLAGIERAAQAVVDAFDDDVVEVEVLVEEPAAVEEVSRRSLSAREGFELEFDNGARVLFTPSDISEGQVALVSESPGGRSMLSVDDGPVAPVAVSTIAASGAGEWDPIQVRRYLADLDVSLSPYIADFSEGFSGSASTTDLEDLFQLVHLQVTGPRVDDVPFRQQVEFARDGVERVALDSGTAATVAVADARTGGGALSAAPTLDALDALTADDVDRIWNDRFGSLDDHVFVLVGDVDEDTVADLARTWIGTLPASTTEDDPEPPESPGAVTERLAVGSGTAGGSYRLLHLAGFGDVDIATRVLADVTTTVLNDRIFTVVREELGATYGGSARIEFGETGNDVELLVSIDGDPARIDEIANTVASELSRLAGGSLTDADFDEAQSVLASEYNFISNGYLIASLFDEADGLGNQVRTRQREFETLQRIAKTDVMKFLFALTTGPDRIDIRNVPN